MLLAALGSLQAGACRHGGGAPATGFATPLRSPGFRLPRRAPADVCVRMRAPGDKYAVGFSDASVTLGGQRIKVPCASRVSVACMRAHALARRLRALQSPSCLDSSAPQTFIGSPTLRAGRRVVSGGRRAEAAQGVSRLCVLRLPEPLRGARARAGWCGVEAPARDASRRCAARTWPDGCALPSVSVAKLFKVLAKIQLPLPARVSMRIRRGANVCLDAPPADATLGAPSVVFRWAWHALANRRPWARGRDRRAGVLGLQQHPTSSSIAPV